MLTALYSASSPAIGAEWVNRTIPNGGGDPEWPVVSNESDAYIEIAATIITQRGSPTNAHCDFWEATPLLWPHI
jgi:hypothetical protein